MAALKGDRVKVKMSDFVPETYRIDNIKDRETFLDIYKGMSVIKICRSLPSVNWHSHVLKQLKSYSPNSQRLAD